MTSSVHCTDAMARETTDKVLKHSEVDWKGGTENESSSGYSFSSYEKFAPKSIEAGYGNEMARGPLVHIKFGRQRHGKL